MNRFERMVAIPEDEYSQLRNAQLVNNPVQQQFTKLSSQYDRQNFIQDPYTRIHRQGETLDEMMKLKDDLRERLEQATPKPYQSRAKSLYDFMKNKLSFSDKGELMDKDGKVIVDSNISDLIQHAVRDRRRNITPLGWKSFLGNLQQTNAPKMLLSYDTLDELQSPKTSINKEISRSPVKGSSPISFTRNVKQEVHTPRNREKKVLMKEEVKRKRSRSPSSFRPKSRRVKKQPDTYLHTKKFY